MLIVMFIRRFPCTSLELQLNESLYVKNNLRCVFIDRFGYPLFKLMVLLPALPLSLTDISFDRYVFEKKINKYFRYCYKKIWPEKSDVASSNANLLDTNSFCDQWWLRQEWQGMPLYLLLYPWYWEPGCCNYFTGKRELRKFEWPIHIQ
jgi:hypothetical protein